MTSLSPYLFKQLEEAPPLLLLLLLLLLGAESVKLLTADSQLDAATSSEHLIPARVAVISPGRPPSHRPHRYVSADVLTIALRSLGSLSHRSTQPVSSVFCAVIHASDGPYYDTIRYEVLRALKS